MYVLTSTQINEINEKPVLCQQGMVTGLQSLHLGSRRVRNSKSSSAPQWVVGHHGLYETPCHNTKLKLYCTKPDNPRGAEICACLHIGRVTFAFLVITRLGLVLDFNNCREMNEPNFTDFLLWPYVHMKWQGQNTIYKGISECWILLY